MKRTFSEETSLSSGLSVNEANEMGYRAFCVLAKDLGYRQAILGRGGFRYVGAKS